jgi:hypothetical protein
LVLAEQETAAQETQAASANLQSTPNYGRTAVRLAKNKTTAHSTATAAFQAPLIVTSAVKVSSQQTVKLAAVAVDQQAQAPTASHHP